MKYWANINGVQLGPVEKEELLGLGLTRDSFVWRQGLEDWVMVQNFSELDDLFPVVTPEVKAPVTDEIPADELSVPSTDADPEDDDTPKEEPMPREEVPPVLPPIPQHPYQQPVYCRTPNVPDEQACPPTNMVWAILSTLLCCQIFGIISIVYAAQVRSRFYAGDVEGARRYSDRAAMWSIASIVTGLISTPFVILFQLL